MKLERYEPLLFSKDALEFKFDSIGPKGRFLKIIQFVETSDPSIYNLTFGDFLPDGSVDDHVKNDNKDRNKILATIAGAIYEFTSNYPDKSIFFKGSTDGRTRLYRMALALNFQELSIDFEIYGVLLRENVFFIEQFEKGKEYYGFVVKRKIN
jgi:hypothetical protein